MHHVYDETPEEVDLDFTNKRLELVSDTNSVYLNHVGKGVFDSKTQQVDTSQYRHRGYKVGSRMIGPDDKDDYYLQPGHPLSPKADKGGRFKNRKDMLQSAEYNYEQK